MSKLIDKVYTENDYANYYDFNKIENSIKIVTDKLIAAGIDIPEYTPRFWVPNEFVYVSLVQIIEDAIANLQHYYYAPDGWIYAKKFSRFETFYYKDINRWVVDLNLLNEMPSDKITIWNYQYFTNWESTDGDLEWEE